MDSLLLAYFCLYHSGRLYDAVLPSFEKEREYFRRADMESITVLDVSHEKLSRTGRTVLHDHTELRLYGGTARAGSDTAPDGGAPDPLVLQGRRRLKRS